MATYTSNYGWTKPSGSDNVDISVLNDNLDNQDRTIHDAFLNMAPPFSESSTYAVDDIVLYGTGLYKCHTAVVTPGSWTGSTNWQVYKLSEGGSGGGGSSLTAGDYIEIDENDKINVKLQKGDYTEYEYRLTGAYSPVNQLTIEKYRNGVLVSTESYRNDASYTPIAIDGLFEIWYSADNPRYYWCYKLLEDSQEHSAGYEDSWYYTDTTTRTETFDVDDESAELVVKGDLGTASAKNVPASGDAGNSEVVLGSDSRLTDSRPASDVSSWAKQSTKPTYTASEVGAIATTQKGVASGVAELDANGKVPSSQLPSYVDDVVEGYYDAVTDRFYTESTFENVIPPESGKSWVDVASNKSYRWTGSVYSRVDEGVQLGETSGSAYRGDRGKTAYDHSQTTGNPHGTTASDVGLGNVPNVSTNDQEPTFTEASTRNNIASGEKLSVIFGKIQKFFNDLKTVAFSGSFSDLSNKPENSNTFQGTIAEWNQLSTAEKKAYDHASIPDSIDGGVTFPANKVVMTGGGNVEDALASGLTNVIAKSMFGGYSAYYRTTQKSIDGIVDNGITAPQTDDMGYFSVENRGNIVGYGNRQFVFGWVNSTKLFAWIVICSFDGIYVGRRANTSTFTIKKLTD